MHSPITRSRFGACKHADSYPLLHASHHSTKLCSLLCALSRFPAYDKPNHMLSKQQPRSMKWQWLHRTTGSTLHIAPPAACPASIIQGSTIVTAACPAAPHYHSHMK